MLTKPEAFDELALLQQLHDVWELPVTSVEYAPLGFGSHHWIARQEQRRWFVTVDDLSARIAGPADTHDLAFDRLERALRTSHRLAEEAGLSFVVAPMLGCAGEVVHRLDERYSLAVHPFLEGYTPDDGGDQYRSDGDRRVVLGLICELHQATPVVADTAVSDDLTVPLRSALEQAVTSLGTTWDSGPYGEAAWRLLRHHAAALERVLVAFDDLASRVMDDQERFVITHGEPGALNVLIVDGRYHLIDWDSARLAAPERDLWELASGGESAVGTYEAATGTRLRSYAIDAYRLWYDLFEIAGYIELFRHPHHHSADTAESWRNLLFFLRPAERWPQLT